MLLNREGFTTTRASIGPARSRAQLLSWQGHAEDQASAGHALRVRRGRAAHHGGAGRELPGGDRGCRLRAGHLPGDGRPHPVAADQTLDAAEEQPGRRADRGGRRRAGRPAGGRDRVDRPAAHRLHQLGTGPHEDRRRLPLAGIEPVDGARVRAPRRQHLPGRRAAVADAADGGLHRRRPGARGAQYVHGADHLRRQPGLARHRRGDEGAAQRVPLRRAAVPGRRARQPGGHRVLRHRRRERGRWCRRAAG